MWMLFFRICDFLCCLIPSHKRRDYLRRVKLFDWHRKFMALQRAFPELNFRRTKMVKGGWNIGFIVDHKYVFKVRKQIDTNIPHKKITQEKRITDALAPITPLRILEIDIVKIDDYVFYKYAFIPGKNLNLFRLSTIIKHRKIWARQIAEFIYAIHNADLPQLHDLKTVNGDGWNHNDLCNNMLVDRRTMKIVGIIDWEYAGWGTLETELQNCEMFSKKIVKSGLGDAIRTEYEKLLKH